MSVEWLIVCRVLPECPIFRNLFVAGGRCSKIICRELHCKLFTASKLLKWYNSKTVQILSDENNEQIILLHLPRATGNFLKFAQVKSGDLLSTRRHHSS